MEVDEEMITEPPLINKKGHSHHLYQGDIHEVDQRGRSHWGMSTPL
jgi:hypothetical protein